MATIYIVRDPRNLVSSISNHYSKSLIDSKDFILKPRFIFGSGKKEQNEEKNNLKTLIGTWAEHYKFWKNENKNFLLIKYEDLVNDTFFELNRIIKFLKKFVQIDSNNEKINNIIKTTCFESLKQLEKNENFNENSYDNLVNKKDFFYLGPANKWQNILDKKIIYEIENALSKEMIELGYLK